MQFAVHSGAVLIRVSLPYIWSHSTMYGVPYYLVQSIYVLLPTLTPTKQPRLQQDPQHRLRRDQKSALDAVYGWCDNTICRTVQLARLDSVPNWIRL